VERGREGEKNPHRREKALTFLMTSKKFRGEEGKRRKETMSIFS